MSIHANNQNGLKIARLCSWKEMETYTTTSVKMNLVKWTFSLEKVIYLIVQRNVMFISGWSDFIYQNIDYLSFIELLKDAIFWN